MIIVIIIVNTFLSKQTNKKRISKQKGPRIISIHLHFVVVADWWYKFHRDVLSSFHNESVKCRQKKEIVKRKSLTKGKRQNWCTHFLYLVDVLGKEETVIWKDSHRGPPITSTRTRGPNEKEMLAISWNPKQASSSHWIVVCDVNNRARSSVRDPSLWSADSSQAPGLRYD